MCPFHEDKKPSLRVNLATGRWACMACGLRGDLVAFVMRLLAAAHELFLAELESRESTNVRDHNGKR
jgi:DNA primase